MPPNKLKKHKESIALGNYIKQHGDEIAPYIYYKKSVNLDSKPYYYIAIPDSKYTRYAKYARQNKTYNYRKRNKIFFLSN
jgi:hypothetical protein